MPWPRVQLQLQKLLPLQRTKPLFVLYYIGFYCFVKSFIDTTKSLCYLLCRIPVEEHYIYCLVSGIYQALEFIHITQAIGASVVIRVNLLGLES